MLLLFILAPKFKQLVGLLRHPIITLLVHSTYTVVVSTFFLWCFSVLLNRYKQPRTSVAERQCQRARRFWSRQTADAKAVEIWGLCATLVSRSTSRSKEVQCPTTFVRASRRALAESSTHPSCQPQPATRGARGSAITQTIARTQHNMITSSLLLIFLPLVWFQCYNCPKNHHHQSWDRRVAGAISIAGGQSHRYRCNARRCYCSERNQADTANICTVRKNHWGFPSSLNVRKSGRSAVR